MKYANLDSQTTHPAAANALYSARAGQCWSSPQEMEAAKPGDHPHGTVDDCEDGSGAFQRIWHSPSACWLNTYA